MIIDEVFTIAEATVLWNLGESTLRKHIQRRKFTNSEIRRSKGTWLITLTAMEQHFGQKPKKKTMV